MSSHVVNVRFPETEPVAVEVTRRRLVWPRFAAASPPPTVPNYCRPWRPRWYVAAPLLLLLIVAMPLALPIRAGIRAWRQARRARRTWRTRRS